MRGWGEAVSEGVKGRGREGTRGGRSKDGPSH